MEEILALLNKQKKKKEENFLIKCQSYGGYLSWLFTMGTWWGFEK